MTSNNRLSADAPPYQVPASSAPAEIRRIPPPPSRHATPSAPWPWIDIRDPVDSKLLNAGVPPVPEDCDHSSCKEKCWKNYPQSRFPNWTEAQVKKCKIRDAIDNYNRDLPCSIYQLDVTKNGVFLDAGQLRIRDDDDARLGEEWDWFKDHKPEPDIQVRALFVENMSGPVLRMLGAKYNIEPFFFSSSLNWIPSCFQEDRREGVGDHITITLPFVQVVPGELVPRRNSPQTSSTSLISTDDDHLITETIDTHTPLRIKMRRSGVDPDGKVSRESALVMDLLSIHLVRNVKGNTIISYHANMDLPTTKADYLHERIRFAGQSVYWEKMLENAEDPTFLLLIFIWQAAYAWDEALQRLNDYICDIETEVMRTSSLDLTQQLHIIRAHHLYYFNLLRSFKKTIMFVRNTPNPSLTKEQREICSSLMERECKALLKEVDRLETGCKMQEERLDNVMNLVFSSVDIFDSKVMQSLTETALKDSASMFVKEIFHMNVQPMNPLTPYSFTLYIIVTMPVTVVTIWVVVAIESSYMFRDDTTIWKRLAWPYYLLQYLRKRARQEKKTLRTPYYGVL